jgi:signal transduction histidine kinase
MKRPSIGGLSTWTILIVVSGLVFGQIASLLVISSVRQSNSEMADVFRLDGRVAAIARAVIKTDPGDRANLVTRLSNATMRVSLDRLPVVENVETGDEQVAEIIDLLQGSIGDDFNNSVLVALQAPGFNTSPEPVVPDPVTKTEQAVNDVGRSFESTQAYLVAVEVGDGSWLNFIAHVSPSSPLVSPMTIAMVGLVMVVVLGITFLALRQLLRPYTELAKAARMTALDLNSDPAPEVGTRESKMAARAFNLMRERLKTMISDRELLAASIAHDLRTPLTRLRLRSDEVMPVALRRLVANDVGEIESMTQSFLAFARENNDPSDAKTRLDLISLVQSIADEVEGCVFTGLDRERVVVVGQPLGLKRCIVNLVDNAVKHGGAARISVLGKERQVVVRIEDNGPGIRKDQVEEAFTPFRQLAAGRGGSGLGLAIAQNVAREHGGWVQLSNIPEGGLAAELIIPRLNEPGF